MTDNLNKDEQQESSGLSFARVMVIANALMVIVTLPLILGVIVAAVADPVPTAVRFGTILDIVFIVLALQGILIVVAFTTLVVQAARFVSMIRSQIQPILDETKETVQSAKGSVEFVGKSASSTFITTGAFVAGAIAFIREIINIRRAMRPSRRSAGQRIEEPTDA